MSAEQEAEKLHKDITGTGLDVDKSSEIFPRFDQLLAIENEEIKRLESVLEIRRQRVKTIDHYRRQSELFIRREVGIMQEKLQKLVGNKITKETPVSDEDDDNIEVQHEPRETRETSTSTSYLSAATARPSNIPNTVSAPIPLKKLYLTPDVSVQGLIVSNNNYNDIPAGSLFWNAMKTCFGIKLMVGSTPVILEGNIGNIYVRGDAVMNVDLCHRSREGKSCSKKECTFRHEPPKRGEVRHYFSALTYYPPHYQTMADVTKNKGVHRIGSREHLKHDLNLINQPEANESKKSFIDQMTSQFLVMLAIKAGSIEVDAAKRLPDHMDPPQFREKNE